MTVKQLQEWLAQQDSDLIVQVCFGLVEDDGETVHQHHNIIEGARYNGKIILTVDTDSFDGDK